MLYVCMYIWMKFMELCECNKRYYPHTCIYEEMNIYILYIINKFSVIVVTIDSENVWYLRG